MKEDGAQSHGLPASTTPVGMHDLVYRYVADLNVAQAIARGVYRFYELTKYLKIEDVHGRRDEAECSVSFPEEECRSRPEKLPVASFKGIEFHCISFGTDRDYVSQYFVCCMSTAASEALMDDCRYRVELHRDQFDLLSQLLNSSSSPYLDTDGRRLFSHGPVEYYDIDHHPTPFPNDRWKEVFLKHRMFMHQREYRAALFLARHAFERTCEGGGEIRRTIYHPETHEKMDFDLVFPVSAGRDPDGWKYVEIDTSTFAERLGVEPGIIADLGEPQRSGVPVEAERE